MMRPKTILRLRRSDWVSALTIIISGGFTVADIATRIRSTGPTVRLMLKGGAEPRHSQGEYLLKMRDAVRSGKLKPKDKSGE